MPIKLFESSTWSSSAYHCAVLLAASTFASGALANPAEDLRYAFMRHELDTGRSGFINTLNEIFNSHARNGAVLTVEQVKAAENISESNFKIHIANFWLQFDRDFDLKISRDEAGRRPVRNEIHIDEKNENQRKSIEAEFKRTSDDHLKKFKIADHDQNGFLEGPELYVSGDTNSATRKFDLQTDLARALLAADPSGDGKLSEIEATQLASTGYEDAQIELKAWKLLAETQRSDTFLGMTFCGLLPRATGSQVYVAAAGVGAGLSSISAAGVKNDQKSTTTAIVNIAKGQQPVTMILVSPSPMIWQLMGDTSKIARVIVADNLGRPSGVTGVGVDKVTFYSPSRCIYSADQKLDRARETLEGQIKEEVASMIYTGRLAVLDIPSIGMTGNKDWVVPRQAEEWRDYIRSLGVEPKTIDEKGKLVPIVHGKRAGYSTRGDAVIDSYPLGIIDIDPKSVVFKTQQAKTNDLPDVLGLKDLVANGAVLENPGHSPTNWTIQKDIRLPPGLNPKTIGTFFVPQGVPPPTGAGMALCIYSEGLRRWVTKAPNCELKE
jgi:hypothetical protein